MHNQFPAQSSVLPMINGSSVEMSLSMAQHVEPERVVKLLSNLGWMSVGNDPDTGERLFQKSDPGMGSDIDSDLSTKWWRWYEAMAYEFAKFVNVGLDA